MYRDYIFTYGLVGLGMSYLNTKIQGFFLQTFKCKKNNHEHSICLLISPWFSVSLSCNFKCVPTLLHLIQ